MYLYFLFFLSWIELLEWPTYTTAIQDTLGSESIVEILKELNYEDIKLLKKAVTKAKI